MAGPGRSIGAVVLLAVLVIGLIQGARSGEETDGGDGGSPAPARSEALAEVVRVVDGDTIEVDLEGVEEDVRYIGVDTPESVQPGTPVECFGSEASRFNRGLVDGRTVLLRFDRELRDAYGRLLAYVFVGERFVNAELVDGGYARTLEIEPNTARAEQLGRLEAAAGSAGRGLWGAC